MFFPRARKNLSTYSANNFTKVNSLDFKSTKYVDELTEESLIKVQQNQHLVAVTVQACFNFREYNFWVPSDARNHYKNDKWVICKYT